MKLPEKFISKLTASYKQLSWAVKSFLLCPIIIYLLWNYILAERLDYFTLNASIFKKLQIKKQNNNWNLTDRKKVGTAPVYTTTKGSRGVSATWLQWCNCQKHCINCAGD